MNCETWPKEDYIQLFMVKRSSRQITNVEQIWDVIKLLKGKQGAIDLLKSDQHDDIWKIINND